MSVPPEHQEMVASEQNDNRNQQIGWYFYDWAISAFSTTVVTVFLGPYLTAIAQAAADATDRVYPLGIPIAVGSFFAYTVSLSVILQVCFLPIMGAIADYSHRKKQLLGIFAYIGALATMSMYVLQGTHYLLGAGLFLIANVAFGTSMVFYNAFLPEIADPEHRDTVSSQGWAAGYLGGGLLLLANLILFTFAGTFGLTPDHAVRISLLSAGMWWALFTVIPLFLLKSRTTIKYLPAGQHYLTVGFAQLWKTLKKARCYPQTLLFLAAYLLYNDGVQAVISLASLYGAQELEMTQSTLIIVILMVQFMAFGGALGFGYIAQWIGAKRAILMSLIIWIGTVTFAFFLPKGHTPLFFIMAIMIALVLGGSQALSRSVFSLMIPKGQESEYFSLYEIGERGTSWLAPLIFGLIFQQTKSYRLAIISLVVFFIGGFVLFVFVNVHQAAIEAGNETPANV